MHRLKSSPFATKMKSSRLWITGILYGVGTSIMLAQTPSSVRLQELTWWQEMIFEIACYIPTVTYLCYAIAGVLSIVGAVRIYIKMQNGEEGVSTSIMMLVGGCFLLVAVAHCVPIMLDMTYTP